MHTIQPQERPQTQLSQSYRFISLDKVSEAAMHRLLLEAFPNHAHEVVDSVMGSYDPAISIGIGSADRLYAAYFLAHNSVCKIVSDENMAAVEDLSPYQDRSGVEGIALAVSGAHRHRSLASMLKNYPRTLGVDYIFGLQYKSLNNLDHWLRRRRLVAYNDTTYCTLEDVRKPTSESQDDDLDAFRYLNELPSAEDGTYDQAEGILREKYEQNEVNGDNYYEIAEEIAFDVAYQHWCRVKGVKITELNFFEPAERLARSILAHLLDYATDTIGIEPSSRYHNEGDVQ